MDLDKNFEKINIRNARSADLETVVEIFDQAFSAKFAQAVRNPVLRKKLWMKVINLNQVTVAELNNDLVGMVLFSYADSPGFHKVSSRSVFELLGFLRTLRAALVFQLFSKLDWKPKAGHVYIEAISVSAQARGMGLGSRLLEDAKQKSSEHGLVALELSVVLENEAAKSLYLRQGFEVIRKKKSFLLSSLTSVSGAVVMRFQL